MRDTPSFSEYDTSLNLWLDDPNDEKMPVYLALVISHLRIRGFTIGPDMRVDELIRDGYYIGRKGDLEVSIDRCGRHMKLEFFQNIVRKNPNGGRYDFQKLENMPFLIRMQYLLERDKLSELMRAHSLPLQRKIRLTGKDYIQDARNELAKTHRGYYDKEPESYNNASGEKGIKVTHGATVYFRRHTGGRWNRGQAFHHINNMWWVLLPCGSVANMASFDLFLTVPEKLHGRTFTEKERLKQQQQAQHQALRKGNEKRITILRDRLTPEFPYYVLSLKHTQKIDPYITIWGQSDGGYSMCFDGAGLYGRESVMKSQGYYNCGHNLAVDRETVERLAVLTDGKCRDFRAGVAVLKNDKPTWRALLANVIAPPRYAEDAIPDLMKTKKRKKAA